ncbi:MULTISPECIES: sensor histidine kinase [Streptomyces]|uniref:Sensor histidine kinase n=1 Tax=Streptomyces griseocarneus TaxID=51201 RepID=A0ABX7RXJ0_9ACTN|nr:MULTISPECIES: histidine kinase [Streptomyces]QSY52171.1 sensor histidine kinase [Streptomyces griseocarneus]
MRIFRSRSRLEQIDLYTRSALYVVPWFFLVLEAGGLVSLAGPRPLPRALAVSLIVVGALQATFGIGLIRRALDRYLRKETTALWGRLVFSFVLLVLALCLFARLLAVSDGNLGQLGSTMFMGLTVAPLGALCLVVRKRTYFGLCTAGSLVATVPFGVMGADAPALTGVAFGALFVSGWVALMARVSGWMLSIIWELDAARAVQSRLAVAEERLRFSRDMHDILGRNLAAIALKSELAEQLSRRGSDTASAQMAEVQRIAQDSQRELREVVRGYREADLHTELVGARGILAAAGIECRMDDTAADELPRQVQSALAWVVREATTNVLRHSDAGRCAVRLRQREGLAVLTVENNGVRPAAPDGAGSGLAGLRERLTALGGTVSYEYGSNETFRLSAKVPVASPAAGAERGSAPLETSEVPARSQGAAPPDAHEPDGLTVDRTGA